MLAKLRTFSLLGIEAVPVDVEVDVSSGALPKTILVGLPEAAVRESTHRVERAMVNCGFERPTDRVVINLAPAELPKQAASFDLPISLGILAASGQLESTLFEAYGAVGELSLEGLMRPVKGALSMAISAARREGLKGLVVPASSAREAAVVEGLEVIPVESLGQAVGFFTGQYPLAATEANVREMFDQYASYEVDYQDVRGQEMAKRAITLAAAGGHNLLMVGPPGSGKTMLAQRLPTILPRLTATESIETTRIYSAMGRLDAGQPLLVQRPFRSPHHTISDAGLVGGGSIPVPGEISLSHNGVLFLDELPEFNRRTLEVLRQPLEDGRVTISRALTSTTFPADFMLIASLNPCPCGYRTDPRRECRCAMIQVERYMAKISGPLLDRIDIQMEVPAVPFQELSSLSVGSSSADMRTQVEQARKIQAERYRHTPVRCNAQLKAARLRQHCALDQQGCKLLKAGVQQLGLSARAHDKILRLARTIADIEGDGSLASRHLQEAINYRMLDRQVG